ncbi:hypothetical protein H6P81_004052 [Aristolochia fimbriata]|uniref:Small-subunit processome Utp12 domain-containing protein n=1 Tax=Aristolochia fimbriata TaxID=158543 RepID=A0AAV7FG55_ARIFI|nr:hypothetical protein H6P81_004052 [Aristolochia fimbriata]
MGWPMGSLNVRDILTSFSPSYDFCAITSGDGRIKIWDTLKGQVQTEFVDITSTDKAVWQANSQNGHLSVDYTCMEWMTLPVKKKKKTRSSLLILGTGSGDLLAVDVSLGQLKWRINDCHPGGVNAISFAHNSSHIYSAGVDGMICQTDGATGELLGKFKSSTKAVSCISVSADGKILAAAAAQLKVFTCSDYKKMQKFSGHPASVRCMSFMEDGKYLLSSAVGERYVAVWKIDGGKKQHACCVLSMDHPAVFLDTKGTESEESDVGMFVLAITELGICYIWHGKNIEELRKTVPTKIFLSFEGPTPKGPRSSLPKIFAGRLQDIAKPADGEVFVAYGSLIKPKFEKLYLQYGKDIVLSSSHDGVLLPKHKKLHNQKSQFFQTEVLALDRANVEDAILPTPKIYTFNDKKRKHGVQNTTPDLAEIIVEVGVHNKERSRLPEIENDSEKVEEDSKSMEDKLRSLGILDKEEDSSRERRRVSDCNAPNSTMNDAQLLIEANLPPKKMRSTISSLSSTDAYKLLKALLAMWTSRSARGKDVLPLICIILVQHGHSVLSQESSSPLIDALFEMTATKAAAFQPLLKLSGRLQLIRAQIDKAGQHTVQAISGDSEVDEIGDKDDDDEEEEVDEYVYGEEDDDISQSLSEDGDL